MLLTLDVGNTHTVIGLFDNEEIKHHWRLPTDKQTTADHLNFVIKGLLNNQGLDFMDIDSLCFCSVVPEVANGLETFGKNSHINLLNIDRIKTTTIKIDYDHPETVGSDRIANAVAVKKLYGLPAIVVDFGTATTFDVVSIEGKYLGGSIAPGVETSINGLLEKAAQLYDIRLETAIKAIGKNTKDSISSGFILGLAGLTDTLIEKIITEINDELACKHVRPVVISTGGFSKLMRPYCKKIDQTDLFLTLKGLQIIYGQYVGNK